MQLRLESEANAVDNWGFYGLMHEVVYRDRKKGRNKRKKCKKKTSPIGFESVLTNG